MKFFIAFAALVAVAIAAPVDSDAEAKVVALNIDQAPEGSYNLKLETSNGINQDETGSLVAIANPEPEGPTQVITVRGSYSYISPDGTPITVNYVADETGYHAEGSHLPVAPVA